MNVRKIHLPFKLPNFSEPRTKESAKASPRRSSNSPHINPRVRAYGKARLDIARRVQTQQDWDALWIPPSHTFPFEFSTSGSWKQCIEYRVDDFAAEIGFWIDILGLQVIAFSPDYVQFSSPGGEFTFAVSATLDGQASTPPGTFRIQFFVQDLLKTVEELVHRSLTFDQPPVPQQPDSTLYFATFSTPHGIPIDLCGEVEVMPVPTEVVEDLATPVYEEKGTTPALQVVTSTPTGNPISLDLYTWDEDEDHVDQSLLPEGNPATLETAEPVSHINNWPVSPDIAGELVTNKRARRISEESPAYTPELPADGPPQAEQDNDLEEWDEQSAARNSSREDEFSETITYEPVD